MSEGVSAHSATQMISGGLIFLGLIFSMVGIEGLGSGCCGLGICGLVIGGLVSAAGGAASTAQGNMVLKQDSSGEWKWSANDLHGAGEQVQGRAAQYNDQSNQIMSRVVSEVRGGKKLEDLETSELDIIASAYGIDSGSKTQKIEALHRSDIATKGLQLGALATVGGLGAVGASKIVKKGRERAIERAEELREQGKEKLRQNVEQGKYNLNAALPTNAQGETATEVAGNVVMDQLSKQIRQRNLTPESLIELGDFNKDGKLDPVEIAGALSAATGMTVPLFIVKDSIKEFDTDGDGTLDAAELYRLWNHLGIEIEDQSMEDELSEIDSVMEEIDDQIVTENFSGPGRVIRVKDSNKKEIRLDGTFLVNGSILGVGQWISDSRYTVQVSDWEDIWWVGEMVETGMLTTSVDTLDEAYKALPTNLEQFWEDEDSANVSDESEDVNEEVVHSGSNASNVELTDGIDTEFEQLIVEMEGARFSSERRELMNKQVSEYLVNLRIKSMERTLLGDPVYRGGQSVHGLIDGGPYVGVVKVPVSFDEQILSLREGDNIKMWVKLVDFSPSLKRPVLEASEII
jgi:ribosomal protein S13